MKCRGRWISAVILVLFLLCSKAYAVMDGLGNDIIPGQLGIGTTLPPNSGVSLFVPSGNVGIGSSAPGQVLDVQGTVRVTAFIGDGSALTNLSGTGWTASGSNVYSTNNGNVGIGTTILSTAGLTVMNGNVGIGTWRPQASLSIISNHPQNIVFRLTNNYFWSFVGKYHHSNPDLNWAVQGAEKIRFQSDGAWCLGGYTSERCKNWTFLGFSSYSLNANTNVGIGTFNPFGAKLIVTGGNVGIASTVPGQTVDIQGAVRISGDANMGISVLTPTSNVASIVAGTGLDVVGNSYIKIQGSGGPVDITGGVTQIAAGSDGQILVLYGTSDVNTVKFDDGDGLKLNSGVSFTMGNDASLRLIYNTTGAFWRELSRSLD